MDVVLAVHSLVRSFILLVAVAAIVKLAIGWARRGAFDRLDRGLVAGYSGLLDLQVLLGLVLLFGEGFFLGQGFPMVRILHAIVMILAVVAGHLPARWRQSPAPTRYRASLAAIVGSLVLIVIGIFIISMQTA